jgi:hypothetical protein
MNTDLKSYASQSIQKAAVSGALHRLCKAASCANVSGAWQTLYVTGDQKWKAEGLLFLYNHDNSPAADPQFAACMADVDTAKVPLIKPARVAVLGPGQVLWLANVARDIVYLRGTGRLSANPTDLSFWYPDLVQFRRRTGVSSSATIEMLTGPWIIAQRRSASAESAEYWMWYRGRGDTRQEFMYLLDYLFKYQILNTSDVTKVVVRIWQHSPECLSNFSHAKSDYSQQLLHLAEDRLASVSCETMDQLLLIFDTVEIGMEVR